MTQRIQNHYEVASEYLHVTDFKRFFLDAHLMFQSSHYWFLVFGHFLQQNYENTKILRNLCLHFARQDGQEGKKWRENHAC